MALHLHLIWSNALIRGWGMGMRIGTPPGRIQKLMKKILVIFASQAAESILRRETRLPVLAYPALH